MPIPGQGNVLKVGDGQVPENYQTIAGLGDIQIDDKVIMVDVTAQDTPDHRKIMQSVLNDTLTVKAPLFFDPLNSQHQQLETDKRTFIERNYLMCWNTSPPVYWKFPMQVTNMSVTAPVANVVKAATDFTCTGAPDFNFTP